MNESIRTRKESMKKVQQVTRQEGMQKKQQRTRHESMQEQWQRAMRKAYKKSNKKVGIMYARKVARNQE